jgi:hypothetical protein
MYNRKEKKGKTDKDKDKVGFEKLRNHRHYENNSGNTEY